MKKRSTTLQKYNFLVGYVHVLRGTRQWNSLPAERKNTILQQIRALLVKLKSFLPAFEFKKLIAAASLVTGFSFTSNAQFAGAQTDPFNYSFTDTLTFPTVGDIDNDGDLDMFTGNETGDIFYYENTGTASAPSFAAPSTNPFVLLNVGSGYMTYPSLADMDNDGDLDMWVGDYYGNLHYFMNTGTVSIPVFDAPLVNPFSLTMVPYNASPVVADMDNDGDLDLWVGDYYGDTHYFQNTGTASAPAFAADQINAFGLVTVAYNASPAPADLDNDGDLDLLIGDYYGDLHYFENTGGAITPAFAADVINPYNLSSVGYYVAPVFADMDGDADPDLFVGESYGVLYYFENLGGIGITELNNSSAIHVYPNPASSIVNIDFKTDLPLAAISVLNLAGQQVLSTQTQNSSSARIDIAALTAGVYTLCVKTSQGNAIYKLVKQ